MGEAKADWGASFKSSIIKRVELQTNRKHYFWNFGKNKRRPTWVVVIWLNTSNLLNLGILMGFVPLLCGRRWPPKTTYSKCWHTKCIFTIFFLPTHHCKCRHYWNSKCFCAPLNGPSGVGTVEDNKTSEEKNGKPLAEIILNRMQMVMRVPFAVIVNIDWLCRSCATHRHICDTYALHYALPVPVK